MVLVTPGANTPVYVCDMLNRRVAGSAVTLLEVPSPQLMLNISESSSPGIGHVPRECERVTLRNGVRRGRQPIDHREHVVHGDVGRGGRGAAILVRHRRRQRVGGRRIVHVGKVVGVGVRRRECAQGRVHARHGTCAVAPVPRWPCGCPAPPGSVKLPVAITEPPSFTAATAGPNAVITGASFSTWMEASAVAFTPCSSVAVMAAVKLPDG